MNTINLITGMLTRAGRVALLPLIVSCAAHAAGYDAARAQGFDLVAHEARGPGNAAQLYWSLCASATHVRLHLPGAIR